MSAEVAKAPLKNKTYYCTTTITTTITTTAAAFTTTAQDIHREKEEQSVVMSYIAVSGPQVCITSVTENLLLSDALAKEVV